MTQSAQSPAVSTYHASDGAAYEKFLGRWTKELAPRFLDFANFVDEGPILDIGTGTGSLAFAMAARWPSRNIVGIDVAEPYIAFARAQSKDQCPQFESGDAVALPYADGSFAGTAAQLVLNFVPNATGAVNEMRRVTQSGGTIAAAVWDFRGGLVYQRLFWDTAAGIDPKAGEARARLFSSELALPEGLPNLFRGAGLNEVQQGSLTIRMKYASFDDYWQPLLGGQGPVGTYVASLGDSLRLNIEDAVRKAYCSGSLDGERSLTATAWAVRGIAP
ncbi:MAG TPA: methyltransferase domain-containing protein [Pseudolabrys sp.]|nr:methyltransferase domain-containing protein [Pseudolabrys sp.]